MPLTLADGLASDMERLKRFRTVLSTTAATIDPDLGERGGLHRTEMIEMLSYLSSELHVAFKPFWHSDSAAERENAGAAVAKRLEFLESQMAGTYLMGPSFTVADAYLFVMLRWAKGFGLPLSPRLLSYFELISERAAVRQALAEEGLA